MIKKIMVTQDNIIQDKYDEFILIGLRRYIKDDGTEVLQAAEHISFGDTFNSIAAKVIADIQYSLDMKVNLGI